MSDKVKMKSTINTSEGSAPYIEALYDSYLEDPNSVSKDWKIYFETLPKNTDSEKIYLIKTL
jgi:2-oxoglutarate dehydrogenase E1 component